MIILRIILLLQLIVVIAEAVLAGQFLSGLDRSVVFHEWTGWGVAAIALLQIAVAVFTKSPSDKFLPFVVSSILILLADLLQIGTGYGRFLHVHVPLGALILAGIAAQIVWVFR